MTKNSNPYDLKTT